MGPRTCALPLCQGGRSQCLPETARGLTATLVLAIGFAREIEGLQR
jgi:hypothetical protein